MALTKAKASNILLTTPAASSNDVTPATTQYVTTALANLADSAPSTLNTLNELAAALGDDANFSTTVTNSIATKLPLAGGTMTGNIVMGDNNISEINKLEIFDSLDNNRLAIYGTASNSFIFDLEGTGSIGNISFNDFKIGIGTNNPDEPLHIYGSGYQRLKIQATGSGSGADLQLKSKNDSTQWILFNDSDSGNNSGVIKYVHSTNKMHFRTNDVDDRLVIDASGQVGIGTSSPARNLVVSSSGQTDLAIVAGTSASAQLQFGDSGDDNIGQIEYNNSTNNMMFYTNASVAMTIDSSQNVTLGGGSAAYNVFTIGRTGTSGQGYAHLKMKTPGASYMDWWDAGSGNTIRLHTHSVNLRMVDQPNGDPCIQFEAAGNIDIDGSYLSGGFDYAEYFESTDGTAIPVGTTVVLVNEKVRAATSGEQPLGVVRPDSDGTSVVGGAAHLKWDGKYLKDDYDAYLYDTVDYWTWKDVGDTNETGDEDQQCWSDRVPTGWTVPSNKTVTPMQRKRLNPDFVENLDADGNQIYSNREERDEWNCIGLLGQVPITKGQVTNSNWTKLKDRSATVELWFIK